MTTQEAIEKVKTIMVSSVTTPEYLQIALEAMKKQIPVRVIRQSWMISKCPCCGKELGEWLEDGYHKDYENLKVCDCGQQLDWSYPEESED